MHSSLPQAGIASRRARLAAWLLDGVIATVLATPFNPVIYYSGAPNFWVAIALGSAGLLVAFAYFVLFDGGQRGATPGKRIVRTRVVDEETGQAIGYRRAIVRRLGYVLGGLAFYLGWAWVLWDSRRQTWHDKLAQTLVVAARS